jgi:heme/copper-type cytochrome/quinol oxidase subunit 2
MPSWRVTSAVVLGGTAAAAVMLQSLDATTDRRDQGTVRQFSISAHEFTFTPSRIDVRQNDIVRITFTASDMAHAFAIDHYRIAKRAAAGRTVVFEFRADQAGTFPFYCSLTHDERFRTMRGEIVISP